MHHFQCLTGHRKASAKNSSKLNKFLHSEVHLLIQHIIVQDQDGQTNMLTLDGTANIILIQSIFSPYISIHKKPPKISDIIKIHKNTIFSL